MNSANNFVKSSNQNIKQLYKQIHFNTQVSNDEEKSPNQIKQNKDILENYYKNPLITHKTTIYYPTKSKQKHKEEQIKKSIEQKYHKYINQLIKSNEALRSHNSYLRKKNLQLNILNKKLNDMIRKKKTNRQTISSHRDDYQTNFGLQDNRHQDQFPLQDQFIITSQRKKNRGQYQSPQIIRNKKKLFTNKQQIYSPSKKNTNYDRNQIVSNIEFEKSTIINEVRSNNQPSSTIRAQKLNITRQSEKTERYMNKSLNIAQRFNIKNNHSLSSLKYHININPKNFDNDLHQTVQPDI